MQKYLVSTSKLSQGELDTSSLYRWQIILYTISNIKELLVGFGPGGTSMFLGQFDIPNPHNFFLEILIDYGFLGIILVLTIFGLSFKKNHDLLKKNITHNLKASCKATIILFYLFLFFTVVPSSLLNYWPYAWLPVYLTLINIGEYNRLKRNGFYMEMAL
jgi:O-antigen ligase